MPNPSELERQEEISQAYTNVLNTFVGTIAEPTCGQCRHWHKNPIDPNNLKAPRAGQCREQLHAVGMPGAQGWGLAAVYPTVPENWPACSRFKAVMSIVS